MSNATVVRAHLIIALKNALAYRLDFVVDAVTELFWIVTTLVPLIVVYRDRTMVAGWSYGEALMVAGCFTLLEAFVQGVVEPSLLSVTERIRNGTFDFVLLKPADPQIVVSVSRIAPWKALNMFTALGFFVYGFVTLGRAPAPQHVLLAMALLVSSAMLMYSLLLFAASLAFYVVRVDNIAYLFTAIFDAARWPRTVFRGGVRFVLTFIVPILVMTSVPAEALLGKITSSAFLLSVGLALVFGTLSRFVWTRSIARYTSAGG